MMPMPRLLRRGLISTTEFATCALWPERRVLWLGGMRFGSLAYYSYLSIQEPRP